MVISTDLDKKLYLNLVAPSSGYFSNICVHTHPFMYHDCTVWKEETELKLITEVAVELFLSAKTQILTPFTFKVSFYQARKLSVPSQ